MKRNKSNWKQLAPCIGLNDHIWGETGVLYFGQAPNLSNLGRVKWFSKTESRGSHTTYTINDSLFTRSRIQNYDGLNWKPLTEDCIYLLRIRPAQLIYSNYFKKAYR